MKKTSLIVTLLALAVLIYTDQRRAHANIQMIPTPSLWVPNGSAVKPQAVILSAFDGGINTPQLGTNYLLKANPNQP